MIYTYDMPSRFIDFFNMEKFDVVDLTEEEFFDKVNSSKLCRFFIDNQGAILKSGIKVLFFEEELNQFFDVYIKDDSYFPSDVILISDDNKRFYCCKSAYSYKKFLLS